MKELAQRMHRLGTESAFEVFARAKHLESQGKNIIHLEIGQPDFQTPMNICQAAFQAMQDGYTGYGPAAGLLELRQAIAEQIDLNLVFRHLEQEPSGSKSLLYKD
jgi:aspartate/methionine/tyrosine aminotransferase